ncbi:hypothetical protein ZWY2020_011766 [Hordeum vulgare]|nr:hypothetical protein ZWY2020_011766 [Hordeum vulgare]
MGPAVVSGKLSCSRIKRHADHRRKPWCASARVQRRRASMSMWVGAGSPAPFPRRELLGHRRALASTTRPQGTHRSSHSQQGPF